MVLWQADVRDAAARDFTVVVADSGWHTVTAQPPVLPLAVERVADAGGDLAWLDTVINSLECMMLWWLDRRDAAGTGLVSIYQPDESGLDMSPKYDALLGIDNTSHNGIAPRWHAAMRELFTAYGQEGATVRDPDTDLRPRRRFVWQDVLVNVIHAHSSLALARLLRRRGRGNAAATWDASAARTTTALLEHCWDESTGAFYDTYLNPADGQSRQARVLTISSLLPLILPNLPPHHAKHLVQHLTNEAEFWLPYPVPSVAATEPSFDPTFATAAIFRGSSWVNLNWYLCQGLRTHGRHDIATELAQRTRAMVAAAGLRECYGPLDAAGHGARDFGWSALILDL